MLKPSFPDLIKISFRSILKNKGRTILTSLGIIIGVFSVILLTSIGNGLQVYIAQQFEALGSNQIYVMPGKILNDQGQFSGPSRGMMTSSFDMKDVLKIKREVKNIDAVLPLIETSAKFKHRTFEKELTVVATNYVYGEISNSIPEEGNGRWFTKEEEDKNANVGVLGFQAAVDLFGSENPLNKSVTSLGKNIKVVGVVKKKGGGIGGGNVDLAIYVPLDLGISIVGNAKIRSIIVKATNKEDIETVKKQVEKVMLKKFDKDAFSVVDQSQILSSINSILGTLTLALTGIAAISLLVGGIGIMNIMLVTVSERTREIGLRKAVGGSPRAILLQFLFEAVILSCIGGLIGVLLGIGATQLVNNFFPAKITINSILLAFLVSSGVGVVFGIQPAYKASKLSPIEALRYE